MTSQLTDPTWAWAPFTPSAERPWTLRWAGHLFRRAAFGGTWQELQESLAAGPQRSIDRLLRPAADVATFNRDCDRLAGADGEAANAHETRAWWLRRMIETPHPLLERMTLFWHDYFGISHARVGHVPSMERYLSTLRRHALGSFAELLAEVSDNPALLVGLGAEANRKARPAVFFARVFLEQYTVGPGRFSEKDVMDTARAFTGRFVFNHALQHINSERDGGGKRILGAAGPFGAKDALRILLQHPGTAETVVRRLYRALISEAEPPRPDLIQPLAARFGKDHDVGRLVETMLRSNLFFSSLAYRQRIRSPAEFALGTIRPAGVMVPTGPLGAALAELGQDLYEPPTIKGWAGGRHWIHHFTLAKRVRLAQELFAEAGPLGGKLDPADLARRSGQRGREAMTQFVFDLWLQGDLPETSRRALTETARTPAARAKDAAALRQVAARAVSSPEFQCG